MINISHWSLNFLGDFMNLNNPFIVASKKRISILTYAALAIVYVIAYQIAVHETHTAVLSSM
jgi:hypothetical protein